MVGLSKDRRAPRGLPVLLAAPLLILFACGAEAPGDATAQSVPDFSLPTLDGRSLGPADYVGEVLLLEFWATWCTPCRAQAKILEELYREYSERNVEFMAVSVGERAETVRSFVDRWPFSYPVVLDSMDELANQLMIYALPTIVVIDRQGKVVYFQSGISQRSSLRRILEQVV